MNKASCFVSCISVKTDLGMKSENPEIIFLVSFEAVLIVYPSSDLLRFRALCGFLRGEARRQSSASIGIQGSDLVMLMEYAEVRPLGSQPL
jgi:hypothetical protein